MGVALHANFRTGVGAMQEQTSVSAVAKSDARSGTSILPKSRSYRWKRSLARTVLMELRNLPRRIVATRKTLLDGCSAEVPLSPWGHNLESFCLENSFLLACIENMQKLESDHSWISPLDVQMLARAFQLGARWGLSNSCSETRYGDKS